MFSNRDLKNLIIPLFLEQLLVMLVGIADTFVVTFVSEDAAAGVSLVNSFNTVFVFLFVALASGGAVVISQYIGHRDNNAAGKTSSQLLMVSVLFSVAVSAAILLCNRPLMGLLFGRVEPAVMDACVTYLRISAYSYPALAIYNAGAALYRSFGNTRTTMYVSVIANLINVVALYSTCQIAANGIAQTIWSIAALVCVSMGPVFITVIGQTMGAGDIGGAEREFKRLMKITLIFSVAWNVLIALVTPVLMAFYPVARETRALVATLVFIHNTFNTLAFPFADSLGKGLRAAGDVRFTTAISIHTTVVIRLALSLLFSVVLPWGVLGLAAAMCMDWTVRGIIFHLRFRSKKWTAYQVI